MRNHLIKLLLPAGAVALTATASFALAPSEEAPARSDRVATVSTKQAMTFAVLRRDQRSGDAIDTDAAGPFGANPKLARKVTTAAGPAWVVPADGAVCLRVADADGFGWTCAPDDEVAASGLLLSLRDGDMNGTAVYGLLPDGAHDAVVRGSSGSRAVALAEGTVGAKSPDAVSLVYVDAAGSRRSVRVP